MQYLILFLEGIITFISPCLLPMLPVYISFFAAGQPDKKRALINAAGFVLGFTLVFIALGAFAGIIGSLVVHHAVAVNIVSGTVVIILGLNYIGIIKIPFLNVTSTRSANVKDLRFFTSLLFGIIFSISWTPCVSAFLGTALMMASRQGSALKGITMLLVYSLGLGVTFIVSAVLIDRLKNAFDFIKRNYRIINIVSGAMLIIIGILMATGQLGRILFFAGGLR